MDIITDIFLLLNFEGENTIPYFFRPPAALSPRKNQLDLFCISVHLFIIAKFGFQEKIQV
jgi:hypothetical protein